MKDRPVHRLIARRSGQRAVVAEVATEAGREQPGNVKSSNEGLLPWKEKGREWESPARATQRDDRPMWTRETTLANHSRVRAIKIQTN